MPRNDEIEFWFSVGSTYTYLTVSRLGQVEAASGVRFRWRPFSVLSIMREMNNIPFSTKPVKAAYMWRDIERRASFHGLSIGLPVPFPLKDSDLANRVAVLGETEGWCVDYVRTVVGSLTAQRLAASRTFQKVWSKSGKTQSALFHWRGPTPSEARTTPLPMRREG